MVNNQNRPSGPNGLVGPYPQFQPGPVSYPQFQTGPAAQPQPQLFYSQPVQPLPVAGNQTQLVTPTIDPFYTQPVQPQPVAVTPQPPPAAAAETAILITDLPDGPAQRAGLLTGDIILRVDGNRVRTIDGLRAAVGGGGNAVTVTYFRPSLGQVLAQDVDVEDARIGVGIRETPIQLTGP
jgi:hypothetical protein